MTPQYGLWIDVKATECQFPRHFQTPHCLTRGYTPGQFPKLPSQDYVNLVVSNVKGFYRFSEFLEKSIHNPVHVAISGDMNKVEAPNDPLFWPFHAFVDKVWYDWQKLNPGSGLNAMEKATILEPFGITAEQAEDIRSLCYSYA